ncbi:hypothetical protein Tco_1355237 [Tanacetum coccineum]
MALPPRDQRHQYLRFGEVVLGLDTPVALQFQLGGVKRHMSWRDFILVLGLHSAEEMQTAGMDVGSVNVPNLLARYLRLFTSGRKHGAMISGDIAKLVKLQICVELDDTWAWVPAGPTRQEGDAGGVAEEASVAPGGSDEDEEMPQAVPPPPRTQGERIARLEEEVHVIMEYLVKITKKARILELKRRHLKITILTTNMSMDDPNITMEEYIRLEEEKSQKRGKVFNWETAKYGKICCNWKILDSLKDFKNEFPAIVYNDALTSKSDFSTKPTLCPQHIDDSDLKNETSLSEYDEVEQNVLYFVDLFPFNIIYPDDLKSDKNDDDNEIDMIQSLGNVAEAKGQSMFTSRAWRLLFDIRGPLVHELILEFFIHLVLEMLCFDLYTARALQFSLGGRKGISSTRGSECLLDRGSHFGGFSGIPPSYTPTGIYTEGMEVGSVNIPYLLARYLRLFTSGRKQGEMISGGLREQPEAAAPQPPPPIAEPARTMAQRFARVEEDVHEIRGALGEQRDILDSMARDFSRFSTWTVIGLSQRMSSHIFVYILWYDDFDLFMHDRTKTASKFSTIVREYVTKPSRISKSRAELRRESVYKSMEAEEKSNLKTSL